MGERLNGDGVPVRHRHVHPGGTVSGPWDAPGSSALETALTATLRADHLDPEAERRALAAFRAAGHGAGGRRARTRRRDDWRLPAQRRARRPARMTFGVVFASLTLGGVAVAAIGSAHSSAHGAGTGRGAAHPSAVAPGGPGATASSAPSGGPGPTDRPATAKDTEAHCRAYAQVGKHGKALDATSWQRLVAAAGGKDKVAAYCSEQLRRATATPSGSAGPGKPDKSAAHGDHGTAGNNGASGKGTSGKGTSGAGAGGTHDTDGSGRANGGKDGGKDGGKHH
ncbi:hypothetical protein ACVB8X_22885 [Streptomyces sp. NRAIS4]